ncbi:MAG: hypothetical protein A2381_10995 [Bdellovibrionales bacterium RIFOXYB1_FULL_37_110]|nr:MAG: hypothetical protein A2181_07135 [Bdellovibrionales bacterium RIFOXYA1_FULL_38_20]OFZ51191.1 MAG: hypothetical protein A2417_17980 [Bdellovibrionales bacterium RIFOXYC1_FULL_37_79]OFZ61297.1 MAG: hypothetical protein A2381_10995 [Bdellovibrionales bacterium RIFOXYB1_FULL_37_110]OFZ62160.1 MAG: hypothetical protein A2577_14570 [Bdellovibrionales bacterium RIFOXYD1_FULL_36_51]
MGNVKCGDMVKMLNQYYILLILVVLGLNISEVYGKRSKPLSGDKQIEKKTTNSTENELQHSDRKDGCFWTERIINGQKDCDSLTPPVALEGQSIFDYFEKNDCKNVSISDLEKACKCVEKRVDFVDSGRVREAQLLKVGVIEQDANRRMDLEKNLEKITLREYLFPSGIPTCDISGRFKKIIASSNKQVQKYETEEKRKFCSLGYDPNRENDLFKNLQNGGVPLLDFEESMNAGLDLVIVTVGQMKKEDAKALNNQKPKDDFLQTASFSEYDKGIKEQLLKVRNVMAKYFESEDNQAAEVFVDNNCGSEKVMKENGYANLCSVLKKLNTYSQPQKKSLKIALEIFTENNEAIENSIKEFVENRATLSQAPVELFNKTKNKQLSELKKSLNDFHRNSCNNVLGDDDKARPGIDTIKSYCFDDAKARKVSVIDNLKKLIHEYEIKGDQNMEQKNLREYATYQYCSDIRSTLVRIRKQKLMGKLVEGKLWIDNFLNTNHIPQACLETDKVIQHNKLSALKANGNAPVSVTAMEIFISPEKPNLFSTHPTVSLVKKGVAKYAPSDYIQSYGGNENGGNENEESRIPGVVVLPKDPVKKNSGGQLSDPHDRGTEGIVVLPDRLVSSSESKRMREIDVGNKKEELVLNPAIAGFKDMVTERKLEVIKDSNNPELLNELKKILQKNDNKSDNNQNLLLLDALKRRIAQLENERLESVNSVKNPLSSGKNSMIAGIVYPGSPGYRQPQMYKGDLLSVDREQYKTRTNNPDSSRISLSEVPLSSAPSKNAPGTNTKAPFQITNGKLVIPESEFLNSVDDLKVANAVENDGVIVIELVDCYPPDVIKTDKADVIKIDKVEKTQENEKCVLMEDGKLIPPEKYMASLEKKKKPSPPNEMSSTGIGNPREKTEVTPPSPQRHRDLKGKL